MYDIDIPNIIVFVIFVIGSSMYFLYQDSIKLLGQYHDLKPLIKFF